MCKKSKKYISKLYDIFTVFFNTSEIVFSVILTFTFDGRFLTHEEMNAVSDYYYAVETDDLELFKTTQPEYYGI